MNILRSAQLYFLLFFAAVSSIWALDPNRQISQYAHTAWRIQDGFFSAPNAITQTTDGYIWIGTLNGLVRFDGVRFVPWTAPKGQSLPDMRITSLLGAHDGSLWIGTTAGLSHLKDGELVNYPGTPIGISNIIQDHTGTIWITRYRITDGKGPLCRVSGKELQCYGVPDGIPVNYGVALSEDSLGNLWIGSYMLCRWRPGSSSTYFEEELRHLKNDPGVLDIAAGPNGSLWAALEGVGPKLGVRHYAEGKWSSYVVPGFDGSLVRAHSLFIDRDKTLWIGGETQGLYHIHGGTADHYLSTNGLSGDAVTSLFQDREGNLWATTTGGIDFFRDTAVVSFSMHEGLSSEGTTSVLTSHDGAVWIGNDEGLDVLRNGKISAIPGLPGPGGHRITALFEDSNHRLWVGVDQRLMIYENGKFTDVKNSDGSPLNSEGGFFAVTEDTDQNIWVMTASHQLVRIKDQKVSEEVPLNGIPYALWIAADQKSGVWIGSSSDKLAHYHDGHLDIISLGSLAHDASTLRTRSLFVDSDNSVWAATPDGLFWWKDGRLHVLNARNGLPCNSVFSSIKDNSGSFWLYTQCGLLKITASQLANWRQRPDSQITVEVFDALDAAQPGTASAQPKVAKSSDGRLWFVNSILLQMIDPDRLYKNNVPPQVHIEEVIANRKSYEPRENLHLPPLIRDLQIDYTALSFSVPRRVRFLYKLEGHDVDWQDPGTRRQAFYSDLHPGRYRFRVIASNNDGVWNDTGATLDFHIAPAWFQTVWFVLLCIVTGIFIVWVLYQMRVQQIASAMGARFDELLAERTRLARDLHDTLLQTIQGSKMVADDALETSSDPVRMHRALEQLADWLEQAMQEGREALRSLRVSTTERNDLAEGFQRATADCVTQSSMDVAFSVVGSAKEMHPIVRDEIYRIGYEAIRNACQHSGGSRLEVELSYSQDLALRVRDNGKGMDVGIAVAGKDGHFGLQGMRERATRIGGKLALVSSATTGTEMKLVVPGGIIFRRKSQGRQSPLEKLRALYKRINQKSTESR